VLLTRTKALRVTGLAAAFLLAAAACGSDDTETTDTTAAEDGGATTAAEDASETSEAASEEPATDGGELSGEIVISGSSTVEPISIAVAEAYAAEQPDVNVSVSGPGTGDGFKQFCAGEIDISDASRAIREEEAATCEEAGISYVELKVGIDGLAVVTSAENTAVACLSFGDLYALAGPESAGMTNWADANDLAIEVGGNGGLPDAELLISAPGPESGTYDSFVELVLTDIAEERGQEPGARVDYSSAADDNVIIETITGTPTSFGWVGYAFADQADGVKMIPVSEEAGGDCIAPEPQTIASNTYPIARDLFVYVNTAKADENPALADFVDFYVTFGLDEAVALADYVPLADDAKAETVAAWEGR
jgi:phosphate transport system substrate-binding protein